jgi:hypothetical protein
VAGIASESHCPFHEKKFTGMKALLCLLLLPALFAQGQTIHRKGDKIVYEGDVTLPRRTTAAIFMQLQNTVGPLVKKGKQPAPLQASEPVIVALGDMRLRTDFSLVRTVHYTLQLTASDSGYTYRIDSVFVTEKKRDGGEKKRTAKALFEDMETSGPVAEGTEKVLNEIDMNFQKLLALLKAKMIKETAAMH